MARKIIENGDYDFTLSRTSKYCVAIFAQVLSWTIWGLFSTPATIELCRRFSTDVTVLNFYPGAIMGIIAGVSFSILEMLFIYLWLWKRNNIYWAGIVICMAVSIAATTGFTDIGHQEAEIKFDSIQSAEQIVQNTRDAIEQEKRQYDSYDREENYFRENRGYVPGYVSARRRQSQERIDSLYAAINMHTENVTSLKRATGAIVTLDPLKSKNKIINFSNFIAVILEIFIVVLLIIGNAVWQKIDPKSDFASRTKSESDRTKSDSDLANSSDGGQLSGGLTSAVRPIVLQSDSKASPIGFGRNDTKVVKNDNKILKVNSVEAICMVYDYFIESDKTFTNVQIAEMVGCDESWVRKVLKRHRGGTE